MYQEDKDKLIMENTAKQFEVIESSIKKAFNYKEPARCPKCGDEIASDEDAICGNCI